MQTNIYIGLLNVFMTLLTVGLSIPLILRKVKMNHVYGARIQKSFKLDEDWYALNEYGGKQLVLWSIPMLVIGLFCFSIPFGEQLSRVFVLLLGVVPVFLCIIGSLVNIYRYAGQL